MTAPIVFLDTETDGVHPDRNVWEVAMIRRDEHGQNETSFYVDIDLRTADPFGLKVGRFYDRHPYGRYLAGQIPDPFLAVKEDGEFVRPRDAAETVARMTHGAHIVGAVPNFDTDVLGNLLREHGLTPAWHYHLIDVEGLAVGYLHGVRMVAEKHPDMLIVRGDHQAGLPWRSDDLSRECGVEPPGDDERHTALGDARWAMRLYDAITGQHEEAAA